MEGPRAYGEPTSVAPGATANVVVDPDARLTIYVNAACTLAWMRSLDDQAPQVWRNVTEPERIWPVDVPGGVHLLRVVAGGGSAVLIRLTYTT